MKRLFAALLLALPAAAAAAPERVSIPSLDGTVVLPAFWFAAGAAPRPVVVNLHGCGGAYDRRDRLSPAYLRDAAYFNREAIHVLVLDSFTPRGLKSICEIPFRQRAVDERVRRDDVFAAMRWLAERPDVDARRIVLLGRSHGGSTVLAAMNAADRSLRDHAPQPRAAVALYPGCGRFTAHAYGAAAPLLVLAGALDDWTPAFRCTDLRARASPAFELVIYPGAHHGFDGTAPVRVRSNVQTKSGEATVGGNPEASAAAYRHLFEFLSSALDQPLALTHEARFAPYPALGTRPIR